MEMAKVTKGPVRRNLFLILVFICGLLTADSRAAERTTPIKIGVLTDSWGPTPGVVGLRDGLTKLGHRENKDFVLGVRFTQGDVTALPAAARNLVQQGVDLLFTVNSAATKAAQAVTKKIPIVFYGGADPIGLGLIQSFAHPGGNITGITDIDLELDGKRLEVLKEMIPGLKRVMFSYHASDTFSAAQAKNFRETARQLNVTLIDKPVRTQEEAQAAFASIRRSDVHGIVVPRSLSLNILGFAVEATSQRGIPTMFFTDWWVENGGLASYGSNLHESGRMAARLVDKIINGEKPAEIPVEVNQHIEFVVNLKIANASGIKIAPEALYKANRIIR